MSIFNNEYPIEQSYTIKDFQVGGKWEREHGTLTYEQALNKPTYTITGKWLSLGFPSDKLVIGDRTNFQPVEAGNYLPTVFKLDYTKYGYGNNGLTCKLRTTPFSFSTLKNVKELVALRLAFEGAGNLLPTLRVGWQNSFKDPVEWVTIPAVEDPDGFVKYYLRKLNAHTYYRFELSWKNTETTYINKLHYISLVYGAEEAER